MSSNKINSGSKVTVEIKPKASDSFKGFLVQARKSDDDSIVGTFETVDDEAQYVSCNNLPQTTVTHRNPSAKTSVKVRWVAPSDFTGGVKILATFVKDYSTFWVKVPSSDLQVTESDPASEPTSESEPESEAEPTTEQKTGESSSSSVQKSGVYAGCDSTKSCFGFPSNCLNCQNCDLFASWRK